MEALLAWQPPRINGSRHLCSLLCLTILKNTGERGLVGGGRGGDQAGLLEVKSGMCTGACVGVARRGEDDMYTRE